MRKLVIIAMISVFLTFSNSIIHAQGFPSPRQFPNFSYQYGQPWGFQPYAPGYFSSINSIGQYGQPWGFQPYIPGNFGSFNSIPQPWSSQVRLSSQSQPNFMFNSAPVIPYFGGAPNNFYAPPINNNGWYAPPNNGYSPFYAPPITNNGWNTYFTSIVAAGRVGLITITEEDNGETITLEEGDRIEIVLPVLYDGEWDEKGRRGDETPPSWESGVIKENYTPVDMNADETKTIRTGQNSFVEINIYWKLTEIAVKTYEAVGEGEFELVLEYFSWSNPDEILDTFSILIKVED